MTIEELVSWLPGVDAIEPEDLSFANNVIEGASVVVREAGSGWWCPASTDPLPAGWIKIPYRAKLMLDLKVKNFFEHRTGAISETTGPISERYLDDIVKQLELTDAEKTLLAELAAAGGDPAATPVVQGIWALSTYVGPLETHQYAPKGVISVPWWRPYWPEYGSIDYFAEGALGSPDA